MALQTGHPDHAVEWISRALAAKPDFPEAHNNLGNALKILDRPEQAAQSFRTALALRPDMAEAHNNLGICLLTLGGFDEALAAFDAALALRPDYSEARAGRAQALERLGRFADAALTYESAIALAPDVADLRNSLGNCLRQSARLAEAVAAYGEAVRLKPDFVEFHVNHGVALTDCRRLAEAESRLRAALALAPDHARATIALGIVLGLLSKGDEAIDILRRAVSLAPNFAPAHVNLGQALMRNHRHQEAAECHHAAIRLHPDYALAHCNLGVTLTELKKLDEAMVAVETALRLRPDLADAHLARANILRLSNRDDETEAELREALRLNPSSAEAHVVMGRFQFYKWRLADAIDSYEQALRLWPDYPAALINLGAPLLMLGRAAETSRCHERVIDHQPDHPTAFGNVLNAAMYRDDLDSEALADLHRRYGRAMAQASPVTPPEPADAKAAGRKLRIGYLSSDLRNHPVGNNLLPLIDSHDRTAFEVHFYAHASRSDSHTDLLRERADGWHDITLMSNREAAERIRADSIDILVSLAGRFDHNRPEICAFRPAPVQISMHDVATSGLDEMDYIVGDGRLLPLPSGEYFTERRLRLPSFYVAEPLPDMPPVPALPRSGPPVFGSFNNPSKFSDTTIRAWGAILAALPEARLVLKFQEAYSATILRDTVLERLRTAGANPGQIELVGAKDSYQGFISRYHDIDIALDTVPFSGSTTSFQALSMGVPVLTMPQDRMVSRWTASMLRTIRLPDLIADGPDEYVAKAIALAGSVDHWRTRRADIRNRVLTSSLCNGRRWTRWLERLYRAAWRRHCLEH
jgi:predicted O-linked N-acetylglucosamine transferase (SPINDLY family)